MSCKLYLENYQNYYKPGDEIVGRVECYFEESTKLRNIKVRLKCKEHNQWTESERHYDAASKRHKTRHVTYHGDNIIFSKQQILYGSESGEYDLRGRHTYQLRFVLPTNLPSNFEGPCGSVRYKLTAIVDKPWRFDDEDDHNLNVKSPLYVDRFPPEEFRQTTFEDEKTVCCWCCKGGDLSMVVVMPRMVFAIGETIDFIVKLTNLCNLNVDQLKVKLDKVVTFKVTSPSHRSKATTDKIFRIQEHGVGAHGEYTYNLSIPIPDYIEVPNFTSCHLFEVHYHFQVEACLDGCSTNLEIDIYPALAHVASQRLGANAASAPPIGFSIIPSSDIATVPPTVPLATIDDVNINPPPYESLLPEKQIYPGGPPTAPFSPASAPPPTPSSSNELSGLISAPPPYNDTMKS